MDQKIVSNVITAVVTSIILGLVGWGAGVFNRGQSALTEDQIETVMNKVLRTDSGLTHAEALSQVNITQAQILTEINGLKDDIHQMQNAILTLASE